MSHRAIVRLKISLSYPFMQMYPVNGTFNQRSVSSNQESHYFVQSAKLHKFLYTFLSLAVYEQRWLLLMTLVVFKSGLTIIDGEPMGGGALWGEPGEQERAVGCVTVCSLFVLPCLLCFLEQSSIVHVVQQFVYRCQGNRKKKSLI